MIVGETRSLALGVAVWFPILLAIGACGGPSALEHAKADFPCGQLTETTVGEGVRKVTGCGTENVYGFDSGTEQWRSVKDRAAFEMDCPKEKLVVHHLGGEEVGVEGCGQKGVYVASTTCGKGTCVFEGWVLNSTTK